MIFLTLNVEGDCMVIDMLEKCKELSREVEDEFYKMSAYSDDIPALEKLSDKMIQLELMKIRLEKYRYDKIQETENVV